MDDPIAAYIRDNRDRYTREAIRDALVAAGHEPGLVEDALQRSWAEAADAARARSARALGRFSTSLFVIGGVIGLGGFALGGSYFAGSLPVFLLAYGGGVGVITALIRWVLPRFRGAGAWSLLLVPVLFFAYYGMLAGACAAARMAR